MQLPCSEESGTNRLLNDLYCVEWDVKLYYTIPLSDIVLLGMSKFYGEK